MDNIRTFEDFQNSRQPCADLRTVFPGDHRYADKAVPGFIYDGVYWIEEITEQGHSKNHAQYYTLCGASDLITPFLDDAEKFLWDNHVQYDVDVDDWDGSECAGYSHACGYHD